MGAKTKRGECHACVFKTTLTAYDGGPLTPGTVWLCDLCAGTKAGNTVTAPSAYPNPAVLQTICYVGNAILAALKARK